MEEFWKRIEGTHRLMVVNLVILGEWMIEYPWGPSHKTPPPQTGHFKKTPEVSSPKNMSIIVYRSCRVPGIESEVDLLND
jgi:hypothetical protein